MDSKDPHFPWLWPSWKPPAFALQVHRRWAKGVRAAQPHTMPTASSTPSLGVPPKHRGYPVCIQGWEHGLPLPNPALHGAPTPGGSPASAVLPSLPTLAGHASNSRIVWEHTRGRYTCMQCPYSTASREEMTLHIEDHRKNLPPPGRLDADMGTALGGNREDAGGPSRVPTCSH